MFFYYGDQTMSDKPEASSKDGTGKNWNEVSNREKELSEKQAEAERHEALEMTEGTTGELSEELDVAQTEAKRNYELFLRAQAEIENLKRRAKIDLENAHKFGIKKLAEDLVLVLDSLDEGLKIKLDDGDEALKQVYTGLRLTYDMLLGTIKKYGVEQINPEGETFNPEHHEAMSAVDADEGVSANTVLTVFQKGYVLNGRILRPARVIVAK
jgi:molecular chaperone GrpE